MDRKTATFPKRGGSGWWVEKDPKGMFKTSGGIWRELPTSRSSPAGAGTLLKKTVDFCRINLET
jgi:hypothetical protein